MKNFLRSFLVLLALLMASLAANAQGVYADVNGDGEVNISDVNAIIDAILDDNVLNNADVNGDGEVNLTDINAVIGSILGDNVPTPPPGPDPGVIPEELMAALIASGMNINYGNEPPILDGTYVMEPLDTVAFIGPFNTWLPYNGEDEGYMVEFEMLSKLIISFLDQQDNYISLLTFPFYYDMEEYDPDEIVFFEDMSIMGHGNKFTICTYYTIDFLFPGEGVGVVFSGEVVGQNIKNLQFASYDIIPDISGSQVFIVILGDHDGITYPTDWEPDDFDLSLKTNRIQPFTTSKMKKMAKSLFKQVKKQ